MHPLIRLVCFVIFAASVSLGEGAIILTGIMLLILVMVVSRQKPSSKLWQMLKRMRIFYLSILLVYLWFTPGEIIFTWIAAWSPTYEGVYLALEKILALCILVAAVEALLRLTPRNHLLSGLYYLATPLTLLGVNRNQFIVRVMLTLDLVTADPPQLLPRGKSATKIPLHHYFHHIAQKLADKITDTINMKKQHAPMMFELQAPPTYLQWLWPIGLFFLFWMIS